MLIRTKDILYFFVIPEAKEYLIIYNKTTDSWLVIKALEGVKPRYNESDQNSLHLIYNIFLLGTPLMPSEYFTNIDVKGPYILGISKMNKETQDIIFNTIREDTNHYIEVTYLELDGDRSGCLYVEKMDTDKKYSFNTKIKKCVFKALEAALKDYEPNKGDN